MSPQLWLVCCAIGGGVLVALAIAYRRLAARREIERAEAALAADYDALERGERGTLPRS